MRIPESTKTLILQTVRQLRKNQTPTEKKFWEAVRNRQRKGKKILRQHPIVFEYDNILRFYIADFFCAEEMLLIEIDGSIHDLTEERDKLRDHMISQLGYRTVRISTFAVEKDIDAVLKTLGL